MKKTEAKINLYFLKFLVQKNMDTTLSKFPFETTDTNNYLVFANNENYQYIIDFEAVYDC